MQSLVSLHTLILPRSPDVAKIKSKMLYASSKDALRKQLVGVAKEYQATDSAEIAWDSLLAAVKA